MSNRDNRMNVPRIRFKGFDGEWGKEKLGNLFAERLDNDPKGEMLSVTMNSGIIKATENGRNDNSNADKSKYKTVKIGDIAYNSMRMWQGASGCSSFEGIVSPAYTVVVPLNGKNSQFFSYYFKTAKLITEFRLHSQGLTQDTWNLKYPAFGRISILYPDNLDEQKAIAQYFRKLDSLIQTTEKKIASLRQVKAASLQAMFPAEGETVPKVRFKGFEGEWKKEKLSKYAKRITRKNSNLATTLPVTISSVNGIISQTSFFNNVVAGSNLKGYYLIKKGEFAYNKSYSNGYPWGSVKRLEKYEMGALSTLYIVFELNAFISQEYALSFFETNLWHREVSIRAAEGARNHGLLNISADDFFDINIIVPTEIAEQEKIASYFTALDKQITTQTQRLEKLKQIKSACLDAMFV